MVDQSELIIHDPCSPKVLFGKAPWPCQGQFSEYMIGKAGNVLKRMTISLSADLVLNPWLKQEQIQGSDHGWDERW